MSNAKLQDCLEPGLRVTVSPATAGGGAAVRIQANREGLISLARLLLYMTQPNVPPGVAVDLRIAGALDAASELDVLLVREV